MKTQYRHKQTLRCIDRIEAVDADHSAVRYIDGYGATINTADIEEVPIFPRYTQDSQHHAA